MKKRLVLLVCAILVFPMLFGCGKVVEEAPTSKLEPFPLLENDTESKSPLGLYAGTVFGIVTKTDAQGITLELQNKTFFFEWTDKAKKHYDLLKIEIGDEVGVLFDTTDDAYVATAIELVSGN